jgi:L-ascorbate metabolism protein UlaG (beta-lactamase superfamily)
MPFSLLALCLMCSLVAPARGADRAAGPEVPPHHTAKGFRNLHVQSGGRFLEFLRWRLGMGPREAPEVPASEVPPYQADLRPPDLNALNHAEPGKIQVTWIGHSTFLVQTGGLNVLTDPIFSERASPVAFAGPKRVVPPGVPLEKLPPIHAVIISHNHYDHLDVRTIARLDPGVHYFVPLGLARWFQKQGIRKVTELDWWQSASFGPLRFQAVPAQHFSLRTLWDANETLWCGWVLESPAGKIFFTGDTGYSPDFREIGRRLGPMRLSLIHLGGYRPRWFMQPMHADPREAVRIHQDVGSQQSLGMHWGTFRLTDEPLGEPPRLLRQILREQRLPPESFTVMAIGETRVFAPIAALAEGR